MKGYTVKMRYTTSIDVFVHSNEATPVEDIVELAKQHIDGLSEDAYQGELIKNLKTDRLQPYEIKKEN